MRLIQAKVRCVEGVTDTGWVVPGRQTTVIYGPTGSGKSFLLKALQALNPVYEIDFEKPFSNHPRVWQQGKYSRRVIPEKKTAVFMVFSAQPNLVRELDNIDPALIETDRIEVGRRLDYSRWITFVEISASTRWCEIADMMKTVRSHLQQSGQGAALAQKAEFVDSLAKTDRVKGEVARECTHWLNAISDYLSEEDGPLFDKCMQRVGRAQRFGIARKRVEEWLPPTIAVSRELIIRDDYPFSLFEIQSPGSDPIIDLLHRMFHSYSLSSSTHRDEFMTRFHDSVAEIELFIPKEIKLPKLLIDNNSFTFSGNVSEDIFEKRVQHLGLISVFSNLCCGRRPLLLIDQLDDEMNSESIEKFISWLQTFGEYSQLIFATGNSELVSSPGWQAVSEIGPGGLLESGLIEK